MNSRARASAAIDLLARSTAGGSLCAALLAQGGRFNEWLDILANLAPVWLAGGGAALVYGLFCDRRRRWAILVPGALAMVLAAVLMVPELTRPIGSAPASARTLRIIQFNTWDENRKVSATADWIAAQNPDIVVVEEAERPIRVALASRGFIETPGVGHVAIFSRRVPIGRPAPLASREWILMPPFARADFKDGFGEYTIVGAHLPQPIYGVAAPQRRMLALMISRYDASRLILIGDFNLAPWSFALRGLDKTLGLNRLDRAVLSWPGHLDILGVRFGTVPLLPIDHVYAASSWRLVRLRRGPRLGSDHFPLVVDLTDTG